jgi:glycosyltransferase involved in cell wall biosynthesis
LRIAFHTPLNRLDDDGISGDRRMARQLVAVLRGLGHDVRPVDAPRGFFRAADPALLAAAQREAGRLRGIWSRDWDETGAAPELWFTFHNYYRAPDLFGPAIAAERGIPYVVAEASDAPRRDHDEWAAHSAAARAGLGEADLHLHFTERDRKGLEPWRGATTALMPLPPFLALAGTLPRKRAGEGPPRLVTVAMMREGTKLNSYLTLARLLAPLRGRSWTLTVIGDGGRRDEVERAFAGFDPGRIAWRGRLGHDRVLEELSAHDLFIWPGVREAYGLVYLEAQAIGLPVVAFDSGGVSATVRAGETALLAPEGDERAFVAHLRRLLDEAALRASMGEAARRFVLSERTPQRAAQILRDGLAVAIANRRARAGR